MRNVLATMAILALMWMVSPVARGDDAAEIKRLIPEATAMTAKDFGKMFDPNRKAAAKLSDFAEPSLTLMILCSVPGNKEQREQFGAVGERQLRVSKILEELNRPNSVTMIHADRIRGLTCEVKGDVARGTVSWEMPKQFRGKFDYVANRKNGKWQITELTMSAYKIHLVRNDKGKWTKK